MPHYLDAIAASPWVLAVVFLVAAAAWSSCSPVTCRADARPPRCALLAGRPLAGFLLGWAGAVVITAAAAGLQGLLPKSSTSDDERTPVSS